jgi:SET domain-containing protein
MKGHILYMSRRKILPGEELTVDYHFSRHEETVLCHCKAKNCRRTINL